MAGWNHDAKTGSTERPSGPTRAQQSLATKEVVVTNDGITAFQEQPLQPIDLVMLLRREGGTWQTKDVSVIRPKNLDTQTAGHSPAVHGHNYRGDGDRFSDGLDDVLEDAIRVWNAQLPA
jgi:hypothetical protein